MDYISKSECKDRGLYRIYARNLRIAVYDAKREEFVGIREKFERLFLDEESHWDHKEDGPPYGTAKPQQLLADELPADIEPSSLLPGYICGYCRGELKDEHDEKYRHAHVGTPCEKGDPIHATLRTNVPLFDWLKKMEEKYPFDLHWDNKE